jgi:hypothetical protein
VAGPGDTIRIQGLTSGGLPVAYSDQAILPNQGPEIFPITFPHGVKLLPNDATPVHVADRLGPPATALIQIAGTSLDPTLESTIRRLHLSGGRVRYSHRL